MFTDEEEYRLGLVFLINIRVDSSETIPSYVKNLYETNGKYEAVQSDMCKTYPHQIYLEPDRGYFSVYDREIIKQVRYNPIQRHQIKAKSITHKPSTFKSSTHESTTAKSFTTDTFTYKAVSSGTAKPKPDTVKRYCIYTACYHVMHMADSSWNTASQQCHNHNLQLLSINSEVEENILVSIMKQSDQLMDFTMVYLNMIQNSQVHINE